MRRVRDQSPIDDALDNLDTSMRGVRKDVSSGYIATAIGKAVIGLALLGAFVGLLVPVWDKIFPSADKPASNIASGHGQNISNSGAGDVNVTNDHSNRPVTNNGGNKNRSIEVSGPVGSGAIINSGGDVNSHNSTVNIQGAVDASGIKELRRSVLRPKLGPKEFLARYIDASVERLDGRPTVALHVLSIPNVEIAGLQDAASGALMELGYHVPNLFREPFAGDGLDKELFAGSATLASQLQLQQHCDGVLLGEVHLKPANNLQGLYISEASLYLHQITVENGAVARNLIIRAKGSGLNADASAASALRELEESIKQQLAEWTLT